MLGYYSNSNAKLRGSKLAIYKTNNRKTFIQTKVGTNTYPKTQAYVHTDAHTYIPTHIQIYIYTYMSMFNVNIYV